MEVLFNECVDEIGGAEFRTPGRLWESIQNLPEEPATGSDAETQTDIINAIIGLVGVVGIGFEDEVIHVSKADDASWHVLRPRIEIAIRAYATV